MTRKLLTSTVEPRAERVRMSAQETVRGHAFSSLPLISSITSNPLMEFLFGPAFFSLTIVALSSNNMDASQPYAKHKLAGEKPDQYKLNETKGDRFYLNKAVMKVKPKQRSSHPRVFNNGLC